VAEADLVAILSAAFPDRVVESTTPARYGNTKRTDVVTFADGETVVLQRSDDSESLRIEAELTRAIGRRTAVPVPTVRGRGILGDTGYVVLEHVAGADLHERFVDLPSAEQRALARRFGRILAALHDEFAFEGYGPVETVGSGSGEETFRTTGGNDWESWYREYAHEGIETLPPAFDDLRESTRAVVESASLPAGPPSRLYPWDFRPGNALYDDGLAAVLDWGGPLAADPGLALAKTEHLVAEWYVEESGPLRRALRGGYRELRALPDVPRVYRLVAVVRSAVDGNGEVTRPRYPERTGTEAVAFHRERIESLL
jgi:aminoglycoside phosphotransferase (APT) family kinase protein